MSDHSTGGGGRRAGWRLAVAAAWAPLAVLAVHVVLDAGLGVYDRRPWLDGPMHVAGGLAVARAIGVVLAASSAAGRVLARVVIVTGTLTAAVLWEFAEFGVDQVAGTNLQVSLPNTMQDLACGLVGALLLAGTRPRRRAMTCV